MHLSRAAELDLKRRAVCEALDSQKVSTIVHDCQGDEAALGWRSRVTLALSRDRDQAWLGAYRRGTHQLQPMDACLLPEPAITEAIRRLLPVLTRHRHLLPRAALRDDGGCGEPATAEALARSVRRSVRYPAHAQELKHGLRHLTLRANSRGEVMACVLGDTSGEELRTALRALAEDALREAKLHSFYAGPTGPGDVIFGAEPPRLLAGASTFLEEVDDLQFELSPRAFFQVHRGAAAKLQAEAAALAVGPRVLDVFSGVGALALRVARQGSQVVAVESVPEAATLGAASAKRNGLTAQFIQGDALTSLKHLAEPFTSVLVNPPRKGLGEGVHEQLARLTRERLVYVSCNPKSLAADLARLAGMGLMTRAVWPFDLFPASEHVEALALLERVR